MEGRKTNSLLFVCCHLKVEHNPPFSLADFKLTEEVWKSATFSAKPERKTLASIQDSKCYRRHYTGVFLKLWGLCKSVSNLILNEE